MISISVIIVSYNVKSFLERAVISIRKALEGFSFEIFVVDNSSGDGSAAMVKERFPEVYLIKNRENVGFARANNQALLRVKGKYICLINPDTLVQEDTFRICLNYLEAHSSVGALGCKIINPDGTLQLSCRRNIPTPWSAFTKIVFLSALFPRSKHFGQYNLTYLNPDQTTEVGALSGSFMMVRKQAVEQVGLLDERFFLYGEDLDWCYRMQQKGWKIVYLPETQIIHYKGQSTHEASFDTRRIFYEAMRLFVKKHFRKERSFLPQWFILFGIWIRASLSFISRQFSKLIVPFLDIAFLQLSLALAIWIRFGDLQLWGYYRIVNVVYTAVWIICLYAMGFYKNRICSATKALEGIIIGFLLNSTWTFFFKQYAFSRQVVLVAGLLNGLFLSSWRAIIYTILHGHHIPFLEHLGIHFIKKRILIVATQQSVGHMLKQFDGRTGLIYKVVGILSFDEKDALQSENGSVPVLGTLQDLERVSSAHRIQEVIFSQEIVHYENLLHILSRGKSLHLHFKMIPQDVDVMTGRTSIEYLEDIPLVDLDFKIFSVPNQLFKRFMDLAVTIFLLPFLLPLFIYLWVHPSFQFRRVLISDGIGHSIQVRQLFKNRQKVNHWLRTIPLYSEVLKGRMSLVGSEILPYSDSTFERGIKPGLTGLVQINFTKKLLEDEIKQYHLYYLKNYTPFLDLKILFKSLFIV